MIGSEATGGKHFLGIGALRGLAGDIDGDFSNGSECKEVPQNCAVVLSTSVT